MSDVFISYSRCDKAFVQVLHKALTESKYDAWVDWEDIPLTADWWEEIKAGIEAADTFLFVIGPNSIASQVCSQEIEHAVTHHKRLAPIVRQEEFNKSLMHPALGKANWLFFKEDNEFEAAFQSLVKTLNTDLAHAKDHTRLLVKALEWDKKQRQDDFLLRGVDLADAEKWLLQAAGKDPNPTTLQGEYIAASRKVSSNRQRTLIGTLGALLAISMVSSGVAFGQFVKADQAREKAERQALNAEIQSRAFSIENLMSSELNTQALWAALELGQEIKQLPQDKSSLLEPSTRLQAVSVLREVYHLDRFLARNTLQGHSDRVNSVSFSPDGAIIASASGNGVVKLWNRSGQELLTLQGHSGAVRSVSFSPDGSLIVSASDDGTIKLWDLSGQELQTLEGHSDWVRSVSFSPDGALIASASDDGTVKLWDLSGQKLQIFKGHSDWVRSVSFSPDGSLIASASKDGTVKLWDFSGQELLTLQGHSDEVTSVRFSPDGSLIASASDDETVKL